MDEAIEVLDHGFVEIDNVSHGEREGWSPQEPRQGMDLSVANGARVSFMKRSLDIGDAERGLIRSLMRDHHGCYDDETEVLTREGWLPWPEVTGDEEFLTRSQSGSPPRFERALRLVRKPFDGEMLRIQSQAVDLLVTPDHNLWASERARGGGWKEPRLRPAREALIRPLRMYAGSEAHTAPTNSRALLLGFFIGDGNFTGTSIAFHLRRPRKIVWLREVATACGFPLAEGKNDQFTLIADAAFRALARSCYLDGEKIIPETVRWDEAWAAGIREGLIESDGSKDARGHIDFSSTSWRLIDQVQALVAFTGGAATRIREQVPAHSGGYGLKPVYCLHLRSGRNIAPRVGWTLEDRAEQVSLEHYQGDVHCVTVRSGLLYVRRRGVPLWCGNSPFEHASITFRVRAPIFVLREWHRHRTASISEASARYTVVPNLFYVPAAEDMRIQVGKANAYTFEAMGAHEADIFRSAMRGTNEGAFETYEWMLSKGVAKEIARTVLPVATYSEMLWTVSARNLMGFLALRNAEAAQREIRFYAQAMESLWEQAMPVTATAFREFGRVKP